VIVYGRSRSFFIMATLQQLKQRFLSFRGQELSFAAEAINAHEAQAVEMISKQLAAGIKSDGSATNYEYAPSTVTRKKKKTGLAGVYDHLTNYDTGASYAGLYFHVEGVQIEAGTDRTQGQYISERMEGLAFMPSPENKSDLLKNFIYPTYVLSVRKFLKL